MRNKPQELDTANNTGDVAEIPMAKPVSYRKMATIEQRVARLERLLLVFMTVATIMAFFCLAMIYAFLRLTKQI